MSYERYIQIGIDEVSEMILNNDLDKMNSLYFESRMGGQASVVKAIGLTQSFTLDILHSTKWFRREVYDESKKCFVAYETDKINFIQHNY